MRIDREYLNRTLAELVAINSVNPAFSGGATGEAAVAEHTARRLEELGLAVERVEPEAGRVSVVGRRRGTGGGRSLLLYSHLDTVGVEGVADPFAPTVRDGRMYGRGAYDMKGGLAGCLGAARALTGAPLRGDLLVVAVADEEEASLGMREVLRTLTADAAVVTEPTELQLCVAHKGFCWAEVETRGRAAHGSRFQEGIDANLRMGRFLAALEPMERALRDRAPHPLLGPPSLHAAVLRGGSGLSTYAERCTLQVERRTVPGESEAQVIGELRGVVDALAAADPAWAATVRPLLTREPFEAPADSPIRRVVRAVAEEVLGRPPSEIGVAYWMDAALLAAAGIDTVVIGPAGGGAHAAEEWVELDSVARLAEVLAVTALRFCA